MSGMTFEGVDGHHTIVRIAAHIEVTQTWTAADVERWEAGDAAELAAAVLDELAAPDHGFLLAMLETTIPGDTAAGTYTVTITNPNGTTTVSSAGHGN